MIGIVNPRKLFIGNKINSLMEKMLSQIASSLKRLRYLALSTLYCNYNLGILLLILPPLILSSLAYTFPVLFLLFSVIVSILTLITIGPLYVPKFINVTYKNNLTRILVKFGIIRYFQAIIVLVFFINDRIFKLVLGITTFLTLIHLGFSRYLFIVIVVNKQIIPDNLYFFVLFLLFLGLFGVYLRLVINLSILFAYTAPFDVTLITLMEEHQTPDPIPASASSDMTSALTGSNKSLFSFHRHNHNHNYPPISTPKI